MDVVAFEEAARRLKAAKVGKGSQIMIAGDLDVKEFTRRDESKGMSNEVTLSFWSYVGGKGNSKPNDKEEQKPEYSGIPQQAKRTACGSIHQANR